MSTSNYDLIELSPIPESNVEKIQALALKRELMLKEASKLKKSFAATGHTHFREEYNKLALAVSETSKEMKRLADEQAVSTGVSCRCYQMINSLCRRFLRRSRRLR